MFMGALFLLLSAGTSVLHGTGASPASDQWSKTYNVSGSSSLRLDTSDANIKVDAWEKNAIQTDVRTEGYKIGDGGIKIYESQSGDHVDIQLKFPTEIFHVGFHRRSVEIVVHVPRKASLDLHTGDGSIDVSGTKGQVSLKSGDGHIRVDGASGTMALNTGDGNIEMNNVDGTLQAHTGDGKLTVKGRFDGLDLRTGDGGIDATALPGSTMRTAWTLHTNDGSLSLKVPENFAAEVYVHTGDGHIDMQMPVEIVGRISPSELHGKLNGGGKLLTLKSGDGSISLEKF